MIVDVQTFRTFLLDASLAASGRERRARSARRRDFAHALTRMFTTAATGNVTYDGQYLVTVPLDSLVALAEVELDRSAPYVEKSA